MTLPFAVQILIMFLIAAAPITILIFLTHRGAMKYESLNTHSESVESEHKVSKEEILEEMFQLRGMLQRIMTATNLSEGEKCILRAKHLPSATRLYPVSATGRKETGEKTIDFLDNYPFFDVLAAATTHIHTSIMERILKKVYGDDYKTYYKIAKQRAISKKKELMDFVCTGAFSGGRYEQ